MDKLYILFKSEQEELYRRLDKYKLLKDEMSELVPKFSNGGKVIKNSEDYKDYVQKSYFYRAFTEDLNNLTVRVVSYFVALKTLDYKFEDEDLVTRMEYIENNTNLLIRFDNNVSTFTFVNPEQQQVYEKIKTYIDVKGTEKSEEGDKGKSSAVKQV